MWVVRHGDDAYVRSVKGPDGPWFQGTRTRSRGRISIDDVERDVAFEDADHALDDAIDEEYRAKYGRYPEFTLRTVLTPQARASTIRLDRRS